MEERQGKRVKLDAPFDFGDMLYWIRMARGSYEIIQNMFKNADWRNSKYYHLIIDTGRIPPEAAAEMIKVAAIAQ